MELTAWVNACLPKARGDRIILNLYSLLSIVNDRVSTVYSQHEISDLMETYDTLQTVVFPGVTKEVH